MKVIPIESFLKLIRYKPKYVGKELVDQVKFIEFPRRFCYSATMEYGTEISAGKDGKVGQTFYWEVIDFSNYDTSKGEIITDVRRHDVIWDRLTRENMKELAEKVNRSLKNIYRRNGPIW